MFKVWINNRKDERNFWHVYEHILLYYIIVICYFETIVSFPISSAIDVTFIVMYSGFKPYSYLIFFTFMDIVFLSWNLKILIYI